jgi:5'-methylthioadenosine/S-adenosylhomocysteine nucleosidase
VDIVILTALDLEYAAVRAHLTGLRTDTDANGTRYETGEIRGRTCRVTLALTGPGNLAAATLTTRAIARFQPKALIFVGVAGGLAHDVAVGDVVVATRVHEYQGGKAAAGGFRTRPRSWPLNHAIEQDAREVARDGTWATLLPGDPAVHFKPIISGNVVLDDRDGPVASFVAQHYDDAVAIDMESAGVAEAAHHNDFYRAVTVRAISDLADGTKRDTDAAGWQRRAVTNAAAFAIAVATRAAEGLAQQGAVALVGAMATSAFLVTRMGVARLFRRLGPDQERTAVTQLDADGDLVTDADEAERDEVREELAPVWRRRLTRLLKDDPDTAEELRHLLGELRSALPEERQQWVQTVIARDNSTVYAALGGNVIHHEADPPP